MEISLNASDAELPVLIFDKKYFNHENCYDIVEFYIKTKHGFILKNSSSNNSTNMLSTFLAGATGIQLIHSNKIIGFDNNNNFIRTDDNKAIEKFYERINHDSKELIIFDVKVIEDFFGMNKVLRGMKLGNFINTYIS